MADYQPEQQELKGIMFSHKVTWFDFTRGKTEIKTFFQGAGVEIKTLSEGDEYNPFVTFEVELNDTQFQRFKGWLDELKKCGWVS